MYRENHTMVDGIEFCDFSFMCMTGGMQPFGLQFGIPGGIDRTDEDIIGAIDAPVNIPAGGFEFIDNPIMTGIYAQTARRD